MAVILVVDDQQDFRELVIEVLSKLGHEVIESPKSGDVPAMVRRWRPALIIMDVLMDGPRRGYTILQEVKSDRLIAHIPVIASTPLGPEEVEAHRTEMRPLVAGILFKPFDIEVLERLVSDILVGEGVAKSSTETDVTRA